MKPRPILNGLILNLVLTGVIVLNLAQSPLQGATIVKENNAEDLNTFGSWVGGAIPSAADIAAWNSTTVASNSTALGGDLGWLGIQIVNPGGDIAIIGANTLTIGRGGIDMGTATHNLAISSSLTLGAGHQVWTLGSGRSLSLSGGTFTRTAGATLNIQNSGTITSTMAGLANTNGLIGAWATVGSGSGTRFASLDGSNNIVSYTGGTAAPTFGYTSSATANYDVSGIGGPFGSSRLANTVRYTGGAGTMTSNSTQTFTFNGLMNAGSGVLTLQATAGGGNLLNVAIGSTNELILHATNAGINVNSAISGAAGAGITVVGPHTVLLNGVSSFTGTTRVNGGTLQVGGAGSINASNGVTVSGGRYLHTSSVASSRAISLINGTLDGTGTVGAVNVADNASAVVANGNGGANVLTLGSVTFGGDAAVNLNLGSGVGLNITGGLLTTPVNGTVTLNANKAGGWDLGPNNLIGYGSFSGSVGDFVMGSISGLNSRQSADSIAVGGGFISLNISGDLPVWTGVAGSVWATAATGDNSGPNNWASKTGQTATNFWTADSPEFNDTYDLGTGPVAVANRLVNIQGASVTPGKVSFHNSAGDYELSSSTGHGIASGSLSKSGSGKLTIATSNTYTGVTTISGGTLQIGDGTTDGSIASSSGIINNGALVYNLVGSQNFSNVISGSGGLAKHGPGTLTLNPGSANTFNGGISVQSGALNANANGVGGNAITLAAGSTWNINGLGTYANTVGSSGPAAIKFIGGGGSATLTGDWSGFSGTYEHSNGPQSTVFSSTAATSSNVAYVQSASAAGQGLIMGVSGGGTYRFGSLSSGLTGALLRNANAVTGTSTVETGALNTSTIWSGVIGGGGGTVALTKVGSGTLALTGNSTYTGATSVSAGTLLVNGTLGNTPVTVASGATFGGGGSAAGGVSIAPGGFISPGSAIDSLTVASATVLGTFLVDFDGTGAGSIDLLEVGGLFDISSGTIDFNQINASLTGSSYVFASYGSIVGSTPTFANVVDLPEGYFIDYAFNNSVSSNNIALVAIPEPRVSLLLVATTACSAFCRRRRRQIANPSNS